MRRFFFRDSIILVSGAAGRPGRSADEANSVAAGAKSNERCLLFSMKAVTNSSAMPVAGASIMKKMVEDGQLRVICAYPKSPAWRTHLIQHQGRD
ncbi:MAG: hypothetical protein U0694_00235 [Anaerolineae bacterium]